MSPTGPMANSLTSPDPDALRQSSKESIEKAHGMVDELKIVQEHENAVLSDDEPPLLRE
jgi:hypothetical protein